MREGAGRSSTQGTRENGTCEEIEGGAARRRIGGAKDGRRTGVEEGRRWYEYDRERLEGEPAIREKGERGVNQNQRWCERRE